MIRPLLRSTLFPYTTLFRSGALRNAEHPHVPERIMLSQGYVQETSADFTPDRKSTRLNSSHRTISYAVFCLKKKSRFTMMLFIHFDIKPLLPLTTVSYYTCT